MICYYIIFKYIDYLGVVSGQREACGVIVKNYYKN